MPDVARQAALPTSKLKGPGGKVSSSNTHTMCRVYSGSSDTAVALVRPHPIEPLNLQKRNAGLPKTLHFGLLRLLWARKMKPQVNEQVRTGGPNFSNRRSVEYLRVRGFGVSGTI